MAIAGKNIAADMERALLMTVLVLLWLITEVVVADSIAWLGIAGTMCLALYGGLSLHGTHILAGTLWGSHCDWYCLERHCN